MISWLCLCCLFASSFRLAGVAPFLSIHIASSDVYTKTLYPSFSFSLKGTIKSFLCVLCSFLERKIVHACQNGKYYLHRYDDDYDATA